MSATLHWTGTATNRWFYGWAALAFAAAAVTAAMSAGLVTVPLAIAGLVCLTFSRLRMDVTGREVRVHWGPWGFPKNRVRLDQIVGVEAVAIRPAHAGGWGYRGSRRLFRSAAAMVRRGPAIKLHLEKGRAFIVTVDDAATGATVLQELTEDGR